MTSVEHVHEYAHVAQEPDLPRGDDKWPSTGNIRFHNVNVVYPGSKAHALKEVNFRVKGGEKVMN